MFVLGWFFLQTNSIFNKSFLTEFLKIVLSLSLRINISPVVLLKYLAGFIDCCYGQFGTINRQNALRYQRVSGDLIRLENHSKFHKKIYIN